jgi:hypothetical protein
MVNVTTRLLGLDGLAVVAVEEDAASDGPVVHVRWRRRRWYCDARACARRTFTESVPQVPAGRG